MPPEASPSGGPSAPSPPTALPDPSLRAELAESLRAALAGAVPGSSVEYRGSLAAHTPGTPDRFSDIDLLWSVPDREFAAVVRPGRAAGVLARVRPVASLRCDPDYLNSDRRRLLFVRFSGVPVFWRLDLDVRAASAAADEHYDADNPAARAADGEWPREESALANGFGVVKNLARGRPETARGLLERGLARVGADPAVVGGGWRDGLRRLAEAAVRSDPGTAAFADELRGWVEATADMLDAANPVGTGEE